MLTYIRFNRYIRYVGISASVLLFVFSLLTFAPLYYHEDGADATANPSTTTLVISSERPSSDISIDVANTYGNFSYDYNGAIFTVTTDNITGYTVTLSGTDDSKKLINTADGETYLDSITSAVSYSDFSAYNYSGNYYSGKWGLRPSYYNSESNGTYDNYYPAPTTTEPMVLRSTSGPNTDMDYYSVGVGARANFNTAPGKYTNTFVIQAVGRPVMYGINYLDTTEDATVADLPVADSSSTSTAVNFTLDSGSPTRDGYTFIGWCDGTVDHTSYPSTCDGDTYMPGATYTFADPSASETNIANFYAMWQITGYRITFNTVDAASIDFNGTTYTNGQSVTVPAGTYSLRGNYAPRYAFSSWAATAGTISNAEYVDYNLNTYTVTEDATITLTGQYVETSIQSINDETFTSTDPIPVYDTRDNQVYWIKRLDDSNVWMMDNLNLGAVDLTNDLTSSNTNLSTTVSASTFNGWKRDYSVFDSSAQPAVVPITPQNSATNSVIDSNSGTKYGTLYDFFAAAVGAVTSEDYSSDIIYDICPAGWRLPTGKEGVANDFTTLYANSSYNTVEKLTAPISEGGAGMTFAGSFMPWTGGSNPADYPRTPSQGAFGDYWSSSSSGPWSQIDMMIQPSGMSLSSYAGRGYWSSIRCILKKKPTITFHTSNAASIEFNGETYTDGQTVQIDPGTYSLRGKYGTKQAFSSWNATAGIISNADYVDYNLNTYEVIGNATITLTGQNVTTAIQNLSSSSCTSTPTPVFDNRDNQVYWIKRLDDGNCWMMDNLNLGAVYLSNDLTSSNTNLSTTISASNFNSYRKASGTATYTSAEYVVLTKVNSTTGDDVDTTSGTKFGALYNYCAASAGTICTDSNSNNATYDICPAGWRLPRGGTTSDATNEFNNLYTNSSYNTGVKMRAPISEGGAAFAMTGYFSSGTPGGQSSGGRYWSSTKYSNSVMYNLYFYSSSSVNPGNTLSRNNGYSIRCILK